VFVLGRREILVIKSKPSLVGLRAVLGAVSLMTTFAAFSLMPMAETTVLLFTASLFIPVLGVFFLGERVGPWRWAAVVIGFAGVVVMAQPGGQVHMLGVMVALGAALMHATLQIVLRYLGRYESPETITFYFLVIGTLVTALPLPFVAVTPTLAEVPLLVRRGAVRRAGAVAAVGRVPQRAGGDRHGVQLQRHRLGDGVRLADLERLAAAHGAGRRRHRDRLQRADHLARKPAPRDHGRAHPREVLNQAFRVYSLNGGAFRPATALRPADLHESYSFSTERLHGGSPPFPVTFRKPTCRRPRLRWATRRHWLERATERGVTVMKPIRQLSIVAAAAAGGPDRRSRVLRCGGDGPASPGPAMDSSLPSLGPRIYVADFDGDGIMPLGLGSQPAWSPDGRQIAFVRDRGPFGSGIFLIDVDGTDASSLDRGCRARMVARRNAARVHQRRGYQPGGR
jgi:hypothetical protein